MNDNPLLQGVEIGDLETISEGTSPHFQSYDHSFTIQNDIKLPLFLSICVIVKAEEKSLFGRAVKSFS
jgi:hypothetical protein